jgi:TrpR-related protein YerC/YecD
MKTNISEDLSKLAQALEQLNSEQEYKDFLRDLLTVAEIQEFAKRLEIAKLLYSTDLSYAKIAKKIGTSTTTVTRVSSWLRQQGGPGYQKVLDRLSSQN